LKGDESMKDTVKAVLSGIGMLIFVYLLVRYGSAAVSIINALAQATTGTIGALQGNAKSDA